MADGRRTERKAKLWAAIPSLTATIVADSTAIGGALLFTSPQTVLRMLGEYTICPNAATVAVDICKVTVGLAKVSADAYALGATAMPDPAGEPEFPWLSLRF